MATKKTTTKKTTNRTVRTAAERIADLQAEIEGIRQRDAAKQLKASDDGRAFNAGRRVPATCQSDSGWTDP